jgi:arginase
MVAAGAEPLPDDQVWLIGARDIDPGEDTALDESGVRCVTVAEMAIVDLPPGPLHVHVDVDVVDPRDMPAVNYPAPSGPTLEAVAQVVRRIAETGRTVALSFSAWNPELPGADLAAAATGHLATAHSQSAT